MPAILAPIFIGIIQTIGITIRKLVIPLVPVALYGTFAIVLLTFCCVIAGVGGSLLFYVVLFFYIKALLSYNPELEAQQQALEAQNMVNQDMYN